MTSFVAPPPPPKPSVPPITVDDLIHALSHYLPTLAPYTHAFGDLDWDRDDETTTIYLFGQTDPQLGRRVKVRALIIGKLCRSGSAKLGGEMFTLDLSSDDIDIKLSVVIEPRLDRTIAIHKIDRWENGTAYFTRTG